MDVKASILWRLRAFVVALIAIHAIRGPLKMAAINDHHEDTKGHSSESPHPGRGRRTRSFKPECGSPPVRT
jgi:hypothetical protein